MMRQLFSKTIDNTLKQSLNGPEIPSFDQTMQYGYVSHIEEPRSIVDWCEVEGYDSHQLARNVGSVHYEMTLMPI